VFIETKTKSLKNS